MRIISGTMRGTKLFTLDSLNTRPTLDRVKEPLFSIIQSKIPEAIILDLFSGSGALGLEAVSRGAKKAYLCDNSKDAIHIIEKNVDKTKAQNHTEIYYKDYRSSLEEFSLKQIKFDIVFLDPPYKTDFSEKAVEIIINNNLLNKDGIIIIETDTTDTVLQNLKRLNVVLYDQRKYGRVSLLFLHAVERK